MNPVKYVNQLLYLFSLSLSIAACTVDKEPDIPAGANNQTAPVFFTTELTAIAHDSLLAKAKLSALGNLAILHHGWVWSENPGPTLQGNKIESNLLGINDSFEMGISGFVLGKTYHLRPYALTGSGVTYGPEKSIFMGIPKIDDMSLLADSACLLRLRIKLQSPLPLLEYGIVYLSGQGTPTLQQNDRQMAGSGIDNGSFDVDLTMLSPNTAYSLRAYGITSQGVGYSRVLPVVTPASTLQSAQFTINTDAEIFRGAIVQFTNTSLGATAYSWSFSDGGGGIEPSPVHTFNTLGNMAVRLKAANGGCELVKDTILKVIANPFENYWVEVEGGTFIMGCTGEQEPCDSDEYPAHQVTLNTFFIGKTEVTQGQWLAVTGNNPSYHIDCGLDCPVEYVSWNRILDEFLPNLYKKTGLMHRLPTEAEWEFAARGGNLSMGYKYAGGNDLKNIAWYHLNSSTKTHPVGKKDPNELGLYDMSGNVWEWCNDWYSNIYYILSPATNPKGAATGSDKVFRGCSWGNVLDANHRAASRESTWPKIASNDVGFRIVRQ